MPAADRSRSRRPAGPGNPAAESVAAVREIYAELSERPIQRGCLQRTECCQFRLTGRTPYLTRGEALLAATAWRATGRTRLPEPADGSCPMLAPGHGQMPHLCQPALWLPHPFLRRGGRAVPAGGGAGFDPAAGSHRRTARRR